MLRLDHLAVGCTSLSEGVAWVEEQLGVPLLPGGKHVQYGTHNRLLGLADGIYFEVIAKDPDAVPEVGHAWFGLDDFTGPPRLANWICQTDDMSRALALAPSAVGKPRDLHRDNLTWKLTVPDDGSLPFDGGFPSLIQWGRGVTHPADTLPDSGCRLIRFEVSHPEADQIRTMMELADDRLTLTTGPLEMRAHFATPTGVRHL